MSSYYIQNRAGVNTLYDKSDSIQVSKYWATFCQKKVNKIVEYQKLLGSAQSAD